MRGVVWVAVVVVVVVVVLHPPPQLPRAFFTARLLRLLRIAKAMRIVRVGHCLASFALHYAHVVSSSMYYAHDDRWGSVHAA